MYVTRKLRRSRVCGRPGFPASPAGTLCAPRTFGTPSHVFASGGMTRMTTTILAVIALTGSLAPAAKPEFQAQTDYGQALKQAADEKKPMAVLIGKGDTFAKLLTDAGLSAEAKKLLTE